MGPKQKSSWLGVALIAIFAAAPAQAWRAMPSRTGEPRSTITARAAILIDNNTGEVLWERNGNLRLPPASTTKVLTAMVALRSGRLEDSFLVSAEAASEPPSKVHLRTGWRVRLLDLIYAILLNSANDASVVIAEGIAGSVPAFADLMNAQAQRLGATNSHFVNPNGLPAADHYTTVRDLATLFSVAVRDPVFDRIAGTESIPIIPTEGGTRAITLRTHNRLLTNYRYDVVGKTGWTIAAKRCFVGAARVGGREVIVAVLGARDLWGDVRKLIEYGFEDTGRPEIEMAGVDADEIASRSRAAGDEGDDDDRSTYSRATKRLRARQGHPATDSSNALSARSRAKTQARAAGQKASQSAQTNKSSDKHKRKSTQLAASTTHKQSLRAAKSSRQVVRSNPSGHARASAAKAVAPARKATNERTHTKTSTRPASRHR